MLKHLDVVRLAHVSLAGAALALALCLPASEAHAQGTTILTFDFAPGAGITNGSLVPQDYGDNVTAATMGNYSYGGSSPFTPNVSALYTGGSTGPSFWDSQYGDLKNVIRGESNQLLLVTLLPDAGYSVTLNSFDLGGWQNQNYTINAVQVFGNGGTLLYNQSNASIQGVSGHSSFLFGGSGISSTGFLTIQIDARNLGSASSNIGIDNISFSQTALSSAAPEPGALALLSTAILPCGAILARRRVRLS